MYRNACIASLIITATIIEILAIKYKDHSLWCLYTALGCIVWVVVTLLFAILASFGLVNLD